MCISTSERFDFSLKTLLVALGNVTLVKGLKRKFEVILPRNYKCGKSIEYYFFGTLSKYVVGCPRKMTDILKCYCV